MAPNSSPFETLAEITTEVLPEVAEGARRNISDMNLLRAAAAEALARYPREGLLALFADVIARHDAVVGNELAALLLALYTTNDDESRIDVLRARFESGEVPEWLNAYSPHSYTRAIIAEAVARHLLVAGGWERPAHLAPSRRGVRSSQPVSTSS